MKREEILWLALLILAVVLVLAEKHLPCLPGDVALATMVQSVLPDSNDWAKGLSSTAEFPPVLVLVAITVVISWKVAGWRAAALSLGSFIGLALLGLWLGPLIAQPRPSAALIRVTGSPSGSAFPSIFALRYASTVGFLAVLAIIRMSGLARWISVIACTGLLLAGMLARIALGAHWPSDICLSYLIGFLWITLLIRFV